jgi:hypothetical protein
VGQPLVAKLLLAVDVALNNGEDVAVNNGGGCLLAQAVDSCEILTWMLGRPVEVRETAAAGRGLVASRDLSLGTLVLQEAPLVAVPQPRHVTFRASATLACASL